MQPREGGSEGEQDGGGGTDGSDHTHPSLWEGPGRGATEQGSQSNEMVRTKNIYLPWVKLSNVLTSKFK